VPHVRAIASSPVLSRPFQTCPDLGEKDTHREKTFLNGNTFRSTAQAEVARESAEEKIMDEQPQNLQALKRAAYVKRERFKFSQELTGLDPDQARALVAEAIRACPDFLRTLMIWDLMSMARRGKVTIACHEERMTRWLRSCRINESGTRRLGELTQRQREDVARCLNGDADAVSLEWFEREHGQAAA
jgi:hypothetical protein